MSEWKTFRRKIETFGFRLAFALVPLIPRPLVWPLSRVLGWAAYWLDRPDRRIALTNLAFALGGELCGRKRAQIARASFQQFALTIIDSVWCRNLKPTNIRRHMEYAEGSLALYDQLAARGKGVIFLGMHYGNYEWMSLGFGFHGYKANIVVQELRNPGVNALFNEVRVRCGHNLIYRKGAAIKLFKALKRGEPLGLLVDLNINDWEGPIPARLFGKWIHANPLPAALAIRTGAALLVTRTYWCQKRKNMCLNSAPRSSGHPPRPGRKPFAPSPTTISGSLNT
ncbi:hypothetical protein QQ056_04220 [Oscillatoria laete-virens NRMC-F 0139]|nr:hypothetical protein [Oscillatoria laete-virens]MDL5052767.1 hypothetical protein [Oscillatoria laete-virens NRMC-F 0139]